MSICSWSNLYSLSSRSWLLGFRRLPIGSCLARSCIFFIALHPLEVPPGGPAGPCGNYSGQ